MRKSVKVKFNVLKINENKKKRLREQNLNIMIYYLLILGILFQGKLNIEKCRNVYSVYERNLFEKEKNKIKKIKKLCIQNRKELPTLDASYYYAHNITHFD